MRGSFALPLVLAASMLGCSGGGGDGGARRDIAFKPVGSLTAASGAGSFRFGARR